MRTDAVRVIDELVEGCGVGLSTRRVGDSFELWVIGGCAAGCFGCRLDDFDLGPECGAVCACSPAAAVVVGERRGGG